MGEQYIGSLISLITKNDMRYVGTLTSISLQDSSLTLSNVRAHGDEGRRPNAPQRGSDQVYELILFKADEIKDLNVLTGDQQPQQQTSAPAPSYNYGSYGVQPPPPAPAQTGQYQSNAWSPPAPASSQYYSLYGSNNNPWAAPPSAPPAQGTPPPPPAPTGPPPYQAPPPQPPAPRAAAPPHGGAPAVAPTVNIAPRGAAKQDTHAALSAPQPKPSNWAQAVGGRGGGRGPAAANGAAPPAGRSGGSGGRGAGNGPAPGRGAPPAAVTGNRSNVPAGLPGQPRPVPPGAVPLPVPKEDYDFEQANAKFKKEKVAKEAVADDGKEAAYKKDDFFDMLTSDALGHRDASNNWHAKMLEQKRLDMETFGGLGGVRHNTFGRGRGGQGGQSGGRGGGGGGGQNYHGGGRGGVPQGGRGYGGGRGGGHGGRGNGGYGGGRGQQGNASAGGRGGSGRGGGGRAGPREGVAAA